MVRTIMRKFFPVILDIIFWVCIAGIVFCGVGIMNTRTMYGNYLVWEGLGFMLFGVAGVILTFGVVYVLLDIRDAVEKR